MPHTGEVTSHNAALVVACSLTRQVVQMCPGADAQWYLTLHLVGRHHSFRRSLQRCSMVFQTTHLYPHCIDSH